MDALHKMNAADSARLVVVDSGKLAGITRTGYYAFVQMKEELTAGVPGALAGWNMTRTGTTRAW